MGNQFQIGVVSDNEDFAHQAIEISIQEIKRIEALLSTYQSNSETNRINQSAGIKPVKVTAETFSLVYRCQRISELTQGAFDISYGGLDASLWNFNTQMKSLPSAQKAKAAIHLINYRNIILDSNEQTIFLREKGMRIGFGGIGKGYAAEMAKKKMQAFGVENGLVNASGDISAWGQSPNQKPWTIGVAHPSFQNEIFSTIDITNRAIATSGNYEKFILIDGIKYSHTIDPKTGYPIRGIKSVTTICPHAEFADAMTTPIMILGVEKGLYMVNQIQDIECIIIDDEDNLHLSKNISVQ